MGIIDDILGKEPEQRTAEFCTDRALSERLSAAQGELERAQRVAKSLVGSANQEQAQEANSLASELEERVADLVAEAKTKLIRFTFGAQDPKVYDDLAAMAEHRPTEKQKIAARKNKQPDPAINVETFPPALIALACIKVETPSGEAGGLTLEEAKEIWRSPAYNASERADLFNAAQAATLTRVRFDIPKG